MTTPILPDYSAPYKPVPNVTPFTIRDGVTMLKKVDYINKYIERILIPWINDNMEELGNDFEEQVNILIAAVNAAIQEVIDSSIEIQDPVVAQLIANINSDTYAALVLWANARYVELSDFNVMGDARYLKLTDFLTSGDARYMVYRVWNGVEYPPRIAGALNCFVGASNPGLLMSGNDIWANPDVTTLSAVAAAMANPASDLHKNTLKAVNTTVDLNIGPAVADMVMGSYGTAPNIIYAWDLVDSGTVSVRFTGKIPPDWNVATLRVWWIHETGTGLAARLNLGFRIATAAGVLSEHTLTADRPSVGPMMVNTSDLANRAITPDSLISGTITRLADAGTDTIVARVGIIAAQLIKVS